MPAQTQIVKKERLAIALMVADSRIAHTRCCAICRAVQSAGQSITTQSAAALIGYGAVPLVPAG